MQTNPTSSLRTVALLCGLLASAALAACSVEVGSGNGGNSGNSSGGVSSGGVSSGGVSSGGVSSGGTTSSSGGTTEPASCTTITVDDTSWENSWGCGPQLDGPCASIFATTFTPAVDSKAGNFVEFGFDPDAIAAGSTVDMANNDALFVLAISSNATATQEDPTPVFFAAAEGSMTLNSANVDFGNVNAKLSNVKLIEVTYNETTEDFVPVENGRCLQLNTSNVVVENDDDDEGPEDPENP